MRPLLALVFAIAILGGVHLFLTAKSQPSGDALDFSPADAKGTFSLEVLLTFDAGPDPFASPGSAESLIVRFKGRIIHTESKPVSNGQAILVENIDGIRIGPNEWFITAVARNPDPNLVHAVRVRILRDGVPIAKSWLESAPGLPVDGPVLVEVPETDVTNHDHEH